MTETTNMCRLCMKTGVTNIYGLDGLLMKISSCLNIKLEPEDGLPSSICEPCEENINNFYNFKIKCIEVDAKLRLVVTNSISSQINLKLEVENIELKDTIDSWLIDGRKTDFNEKFLENDLTAVKNEITRSFLGQKECQIDCSGTIPFYDKSKTFQCELCGRFFQTKSILKKHLMSHEGIKLYSCKICSKKFTRAAHKIVHMRIHTGIRPYICEICGKSATKRQDLIRHLKIHSDEKNYACPQCGKKFKRSGDVHCHMRTHTGARPFKCSDCEKCYTSHSGLRKHYRTQCKKDIMLVKHQKMESSNKRSS